MSANFRHAALKLRTVRDTTPMALSAHRRALQKRGFPTAFPLRPRSPRKLEPHEVIAKLKARKPVHP